jgi:hypothetical protein
VAKRYPWEIPSWVWGCPSQGGMPETIRFADKLSHQQAAASNDLRDTQVPDGTWCRVMSTDIRSKKGMGPTCLKYLCHLCNKSLCDIKRHDLRYPKTLCDRKRDSLYFPPLPGHWNKKAKNGRSAAYSERPHRPI